MKNQFNFSILATLFFVMTSMQVFSQNTINSPKGIAKFMKQVPAQKQKTVEAIPGLTVAADGMLAVEEGYRLMATNQSNKPSSSEEEVKGYIFRVVQEVHSERMYFRDDDVVVTLNCACANETVTTDENGNDSSPFSQNSFGEVSCGGLNCCEMSVSILGVIGY